MNNGLVSMATKPQNTAETLAGIGNLGCARVVTKRFKVVSIHVALNTTAIRNQFKYHCIFKVIKECDSLENIIAMGSVAAS